MKTRVKTAPLKYAPTSKAFLVILMAEVDKWGAISTFNFTD